VIFTGDGDGEGDGAGNGGGDQVGGDAAAEPHAERTKQATRIINRRNATRDMTIRGDHRLVGVRNIFWTGGSIFAASPWQL
jgi:hypothetical protein